MDDFSGLLSPNFGLHPQGKAAPMSSASARATAPSPSFGSKPSPSRGLEGLDDMFAAPSARPPPQQHGFVPQKASAPPVYDKPVFDEDLFVGIPGLKPSSGQFNDVFMRSSSGPDRSRGQGRGRVPVEEDDLLRSLSGKGVPRDSSPPVNRKEGNVATGFEELFQGFGRPEPAVPRREYSDPAHQNSSGFTTKSTTSSNDPFADFGTVPVAPRSSPTVPVDPLESLKFSSSGTKSNMSSGTLDDKNVFKEVKKSDSPDTDVTQVDGKRKNTKGGSYRGNSPAFEDIAEQISDKKVGDAPELKGFDEVFQNHHPYFHTPLEPSVHKTSAGKRGTQTKNKSNAYDGREESRQQFDDIWLTVSEVPLFTHPTMAPPPSRPPPPLVKSRTSFASTGNVKVASNNSNTKRNFITSPFPQHSNDRNYSDHPNGEESGFGISSIGLEEFGSTKFESSNGSRFGFFHNEVLPETNLAAANSAAAMKDAMDKAEVKFKHARELREREKEQGYLKTRESGAHQQTENAVPDFQVQEMKETRLNADTDREQREKEAKEERRRLEREQEKAAVEKAMKEAQERAATEARQKAQRAAVEKATAEARERAARAAALRAEAEARAAAEAKEKSDKEAKEKAAREAREKEIREREAKEREAREKEVREREVREREAREREAREREAREKATRDRERAAVERAAEDARRRAARAAFDKANAEARERAAAAAAAAAAAKEQQTRNNNDLESFFDMGSRANSQPKQRTTMDPYDSQVRSQSGNNGSRSSSGPSSTIRKASSATNILDDLSSVFGAPSPGEFPEIEGESEERRKARFERHQRTLERAAKALAEKNERDTQIQREQAERHRISETLDAEIKRWSAGKEGNLRALLSTLQYVLWPECGWQPVSLTDLITSAAVKKVYRKATLCIHPDKVQQKGANLQQKYIAEKVFDLLKEAWNKFNSEELF